MECQQQTSSSPQTISRSQFFECFLAILYGDSSGCIFSHSSAQGIPEHAMLGRVWIQTPWSEAGEMISRKKLSPQVTNLFLQVTRCKKWWRISDKKHAFDKLFWNGEFGRQATCWRKASSLCLFLGMLPAVSKGSIWLRSVSPVKMFGCEHDVRYKV